MSLAAPTPFPLTLQCEYTGQITPFRELLSTLYSCGFYGIELNLPDFKYCTPSQMLTILDEYELKLTYLATGAYAKKYNLSLSNSDLSQRRAAICGCKENIDYARELGSGIIIGFMKSSGDDAGRDAEQYLAESLTEVTSYASKCNVTILLEATNRYEAGVANSLQQTARIVKEIHSPAIKILPDTYHMNIEESHPYEVLNQYLDWIPNLHLSDNNRYFPGYGCINFGDYMKLLLICGYQGTLGIEGNWKHGMKYDIEQTSSYLKYVSDQVCAQGQIVV